MIDKILHIMKGPKGVLTMCIVSFTESIFFIIPPDPFLALLCIKKKISELCKFTLLCTFYSVLGGCVAYYLGDQIVSLSQKYDIKLINKYINDIESLKLKIDNQTFIMMLTSAFTPLPFKIFCISAGAINVNFVDFIFGSILGRGSRFFIFGYLGYKYGHDFERITKSKKFNLIMIGLIGVLIIYLYYKWN